MQIPVFIYAGSDALFNLKQHRRESGYLDSASSDSSGFYFLFSRRLFHSSAKDFPVRMKDQCECLILLRRIYILMFCIREIEERRDRRRYTVSADPIYIILHVIDRDPLKSIRIIVPLIESGLFGIDFVKFLYIASFLPGCTYMYM